MSIPQFTNAAFTDYFFHWEKIKPNDVFLRQPKGSEWKTYTYKEVGEQARKLANFLESKGITKNTHVGIISKNCAEWIITDLALLMLGAISTPFYANLNCAEFEVVLRESDSKFLFVGKLETWDQIKNAIPDDIEVFTFKDHAGHSKIDRGIKWDTILNETQPKEFHPTFNDDDIWTILFTSGTTGSPKGVVLTYGNMRHIIKVETTQHVIGLKDILGNAHFISVLPLNHIGERMAVEMACLITGGTISFVESINTFVQNIQDTQPTLMFTVPHLWSKFQLGVLEKMPQKRLDLLFKIPIVSGIVKKKIKHKLGLSRMVHPITASAPIPPDLKQWYIDLGLDLREVYGMTETTGLTILTPKGNKKIGTVGLPIDGLELKIDDETKEILLKGPSILKGYYKNPEKSNEVIKDEWLHTGDRGRLDDDGYLYIDGRIQDAFKTSKGKYVVPSPIEWKFGTNENIEQIVVVGLGLAQPLALIKLSEIGKTKTKKEIEENLMPELKRVNEELINFQRLSHLVIVDDEWTIENKILTPTLKVKRNLIQEKYQDKFKQWANQTEKIIWT